MWSVRTLSHSCRIFYCLKNTKRIIITIILQYKLYNFCINQRQLFMTSGQNSDTSIEITDANFL